MKWQFYKEECGNPLDGFDYNWGWMCSECSWEIPGTLIDDCDPDYYPDFNFCPNCGSPLGEQKALTLEELEEMNGQPVWIELSYNKPQWAMINSSSDECLIVYITFVNGDSRSMRGKDYGDSWVCYRHKPTERG